MGVVRVPRICDTVEFKVLPRGKYGSNSFSGSQTNVTLEVAFVSTGSLAELISRLIGMLFCLSHASILSMTVRVSYRVISAPPITRTSQSRQLISIEPSSNQKLTGFVSGSAMPTTVETQPGVVAQSRQGTLAAPESLRNISKDSQRRILGAFVVNVRIQRRRRYRHITSISLMRCVQMIEDFRNIPTSQLYYNVFYYGGVACVWANCAC